MDTKLSVKNQDFPLNHFLPGHLTQMKTPNSFCDTHLSGDWHLRLGKAWFPGSESLECTDR